MKLTGAPGPSGGWVRADLVQSPGPVAYVPVEDLEATLDEVERAGGRVLVRSLPFAGGGEVGLFADPDGNVLGLWKRKEAGAPPAAPAKPSAPAKPAQVAKPAAKKPAKKK
jgi:predicted enzyme related to lactoylglutathione lyase